MSKNPTANTVAGCFGKDYTLKNLKLFAISKGYPESVVNKITTKPALCKLLFSAKAPSPEKKIPINKPTLLKKKPASPKKKPAKSKREVKSPAKVLPKTKTDLVNAFVLRFGTQYKNFANSLRIPDLKSYLSGMECNSDKPCEEGSCDLDNYVCVSDDARDYAINIKGSGLTSRKIGNNTFFGSEKALNALKRKLPSRKLPPSADKTCKLLKKLGAEDLNKIHKRIVTMIQKQKEKEANAKQQLAEAKAEAKAAREEERAKAKAAKVAEQEAKQQKTVAKAAKAAKAEKEAKVATKKAEKAKVKVEKVEEKVEKVKVEKVKKSAKIRPPPVDSSTAALVQQIKNCLQLS